MDVMNVVPESMFDIEDVRREWRGRDIGRSVGRYPVEFDPIRRFCHMTGQTNPLYLDPVAAAAGPYGRVQCPPTFVRYFMGAGPWPHDRDEPSQIPPDIPRLGDRGINLKTAWTYDEPVLVGDSLRAEWQVVDVYCKPTRLDPRSVWIETSAELRNQHDRVVATMQNTVLYHRPASESGAPADDTSDSATEHGRAAGVEVFSIELTPTELALQVSGSQDWNPVHHDEAYALSSGHKAMFFNTAWTQGMLGRIVDEYIADRPWRLAALNFRMQRMNSLGDSVSGRYVPPTDPAEPLHDVDLTLVSSASGTTTVATATIATTEPVIQGGGAR